MASRRHNNNKISDPAKDIKKKIAGSTDFKCSSSLKTCSAPSKNVTSENLLTPGPSKLKECSESMKITKMQLPKTSKLPVLIGRKIQKANANSGEGSFSLIGLSLKEVTPTQVDASVGTESTAVLVPQVVTSAIASVGNRFKVVEDETDLHPTHSSLEDEATFDFYRNKLAKFRGPDMQATVREISQILISDRVLKDYSYLGRRKKLRFKDYDNLTKLIISSTIESMKRVNREIFGKEKEESDEEKKKLHDEVEEYFTKEYIKKATTRYNQTIKK